MRFLIQSTHHADGAMRALGATLHEQFRELDFNSPQHLIDTLRDHFTTNRLDLRVSQVGGVINVVNDAGILLHFRSPN